MRADDATVRTVRTESWVSAALVVMAVSLCLTGCADDSAPRSASPASTTLRLPAATPVAANLLQVCAHAQDAFRSGGLDDAEQSKALSAELQGMMDVADPGAAQALRPMAEAAGAIAADDRARARRALQRAENRAYGTLQRVCIGAGSQAWSG
jgi:hypothetical protein